MEQKKTEYKSCFSESIENLVNEKKSLGYAYKFQSEIFAKFDKFCIDNKINSECITNEIATLWELYIENTGKSYKERGISCICALSEYLCLHGKKSFIPQRYTNHQKVVGIFVLLGMEKNQDKRMLWIYFGMRRKRNGKIIED